MSQLLYVIPFTPQTGEYGQRYSTSGQHSANPTYWIDTPFFSLIQRLVRHSPLSCNSSPTFQVWFWYWHSVLFSKHYLWYKSNSKTATLKIECYEIIIPTQFSLRVGVSPFFLSIFWQSQELKLKLIEVTIMTGSRETGVGGGGEETAGKGWGRKDREGKKQLR